MNPRTPEPAAVDRPTRGAQPLPQLSLLGVDYWKHCPATGGELYLTRYGRPFLAQLDPGQWYAPDWFESHRQRLVGTSVIYRVESRPVDGRALDLVVRFNRVGERVPVDTVTLCQFVHADFNSPHEEFSLLMDLRAGRFGPSGLRIHTQKPLAIFVPPGRLALWQTGRLEHKIAAKLARHPGVDLDILRDYLVVFGWIDGLDATQMANALDLEGAVREKFLTETVSFVTDQLAQKGFRVLDMKPAHVILRRQRNGSLLRDAQGRLVYALVDYELLDRTPDYEETLRRHGAPGADAAPPTPVVADNRPALPPHLQPHEILDVPYLYGRVASTGGRLWVVGRDPEEFNHFLPERWQRTPARQLAREREVYLTLTKDHRHVVWRLSAFSNAAAKPAALEPAPPPNTPFDEFSIAQQLRQAGVNTVRPLAIYATGHRLDPSPAPQLAEVAHRLGHLRTPDGDPLLDGGQTYLTLWEFWWGGLHEEARAGASPRGGPLNLPHTVETGLLRPEAAQTVLLEAQNRIRSAGLDPATVRPDHLLLCWREGEGLQREADGTFHWALCNVEQLRPARPAGVASSHPRPP
jgi:hypothetical protein